MTRSKRTRTRATSTNNKKDDNTISILKNICKSNCIQLPPAANDRGGTTSIGAIVCNIYHQFLSPNKWITHRAGGDKADWIFIPCNLIEKHTVAEIKRNGQIDVHFFYGWEKLALMIIRFGLFYAPSSLTVDDSSKKKEKNEDDEEEIVDASCRPAGRKRSRTTTHDDQNNNNTSAAAAAVSPHLQQTQTSMNNTTTTTKVTAEQQQTTVPSSPSSSTCSSMKSSSIISISNGNNEQLPQPSSSSSSNQGNSNNEIISVDLADGIGNSDIDSLLSNEWGDQFDSMEMDIHEDDFSFSDMLIRSDLGEEDDDSRSIIFLPPPNPFTNNINRVNHDESHNEEGEEDCMDELLSFIS